RLFSSFKCNDSTIYPNYIGINKREYRVQN
ncbi:unnamed protein product, partial [marine sediment metagenome]